MSIIHSMPAMWYSYACMENVSICSCCCPAASSAAFAHLLDRQQQQQLAVDHEQIRQCGQHIQLAVVLDPSPWSGRMAT